MLRLTWLANLAAVGSIVYFGMTSCAKTTTGLAILAISSSIVFFIISCILQPFTTSQFGRLDIL